MKGFSDSTDLQKRVLTIAVGVTQLEVVGEEWKSEGGAYHQSTQEKNQK
ncbi:MAG: hypothetical protein HQ568_03350 [Calditrichaeota bacterium]|nr:hypothetical protein [Calditrichota bacterium]